MKKLLLILSLLVAFACPAQYPAQTASVAISAVASASPAKITLTWTAFSGTTGFTLSRKTKAQTTWTQIATPASNATTYEDATAVVGTYYEYKLVRTASAGTGYGYIAAGITLPVVDSRGKMVLLVADNMTTPLATPLSQLVADLRGDGWVVLRHDVSTSASPTTIKAVIQSDYNADPTNVKAVFIFGHVPVPYSGNINPDGHGNHQGAWPCDGYYGDMDGVWTDSTVNNTSSSADGTRNDNVPGDGKFDQSSYPSALELQVGRVDLYNMESFSFYAGLSETQLLTNYLTKLHNFKIKQFTPTFRGGVFDNFEDVSQPLLAGGYRSVFSNVGPSNTTDWNGNGSPYSSYINGQSYLWTATAGGGQFTSSQNVTSTGELAQSVVNGAIFNQMIGSYFGDWDCMNNFLRAPLCSGNGLTNCYNGLPAFFWLHHMGMGDNIGYGTLVSMNNVATTGTYQPQGPAYQGVSAGNNRVNMGLMGDPSLRQISVAPPSNLAITNSGGFASWSWTAASGSPLGYHVYDLGTGSTAPVRLTTDPVNATSWSPGTVPFVAARQYMVRAVVLTTGATGTYYNMSLGALGTSASTPTILVSPRAFLEGPYVSGVGTMSDGLRTLSTFPLSDPYPALGYVHVGTGATGTINASALTVTGNNAIVDWVVVEIRSNASPYAVVASKSVLVQRDGDVVDRDGTSAVSFQVAAATYRVAVRHRNHLAIMSGAGIALTTTTTSVNFTSVNTSMYGTNPRKNVIGSFSTWVMYAGDVNFNNQIKYVGTANDKDIILVAVGGSTPNNTITNAYSGSDTNMDGLIRYAGSLNDRDIILVNVGSTTPNNVRTAQLP